MYHGVYVKTRPKSKWLLFSVNASPEATAVNAEKALKQAKEDGYEKAEVAIKIYSDINYIPEMLNEIKNQELLYN